MNLKSLKSITINLAYVNAKTHVLIHFMKDWKWVPAGMILKRKNN